MKDLIQKILAIPTAYIKPQGNPSIRSPGDTHAQNTGTSWISFWSDKPPLRKFSTHALITARTAIQTTPWCATRTLAPAQEVPSWQEARESSHWCQQVEPARPCGAVCWEAWERTENLTDRRLCHGEVGYPAGYHAPHCVGHLWEKDPEVTRLVWSQVRRDDSRHWSQAHRSSGVQAVLQREKPADSPGSQEQSSANCHTLCQRVLVRA